jgi:general secretion pathway protein G
MGAKATYSNKPSISPGNSDGQCRWPVGNANGNHCQQEDLPMTDRIKRLKVENRDAGFTLIELLVVITILGILAAIVVFSVGGISDKGATSACKTDTTTLQTAEEANFAKGAPSNGVPAGQYVSEVQLVTAGLLNSASNLHDISIDTTGSKYLVTLPSTAPASNPCSDAPASGTAPS